VALDWQELIDSMPVPSGPGPNSDKLGIDEQGIPRSTRQRQSGRGASDESEAWRSELDLFSEAGCRQRRQARERRCVEIGGKRAA